MCRPVGPPQYRGRTPRAVGATLVSPGRSAAISQFAGTTAYTAQRNATDGSCRSGTGRHKWRPTCIVARRRAATPPAPPRPPRRSAAISWPNIPQRRGDTCVARMTAAISQFAGTTAYTAQRNAADGSCRSGTGRHKWRPYVHRRASSRRNAAGTTGPPRRSAAISRPVCMSGACEKKRTAVRSCRRECLTLHLVSTAP